MHSVTCVGSPHVKIRIVVRPSNITASSRRISRKPIISTRPRSRSCSGSLRMEGTCPGESCTCSCRRHHLGSLLAAAVAAILVAAEVGGGLSEATSPVVRHSPCTLLLELQSAECDTDVAHLAPELAPRVAHDPVLAVGLAVGAPADDGDDVVHTLARVGGDAASVLEDGRCVDAASDGATLVDLLLHGVSTRDGPVLGDGGVGVVGDSTAEARRWEGGASASDVVVGALPLGSLAEALLALGGASHVRVRGVVRDARALLGDGVQPLVWAIDRPTVAGADVTAVENVLNAEVNVGADLALLRTSDLDAVAESAHRPVCPA